MEATAEQSAEGLAIVRVLSAVLDRLVHANAMIARSDPGQVTKFHAMKAPGIAIEQYLERIHKYASCSNECFILALIYIDRLIQRNNFLLTELNVHRVVISAVLLAAKFFDDAYYNNAYYAKVGGVLVSEMNGLEVEFLFRINFSLHVLPDVFEKYRAELLSHSVEQTQQAPHPMPVTPGTNTQPHETGMSLTTAESMVDAASHITPSPESESCRQAREIDMGRLQPTVSNEETAATSTRHHHQQQEHFCVGQSHHFPADYNFVDSLVQQQPSQAYSNTKQSEYGSYRNNSTNATTHHPATYNTFPTPPIYQSHSATTQQLCSGVAAQQSSSSAPPVLVSVGPVPAPPHNPFHTGDYVAASSRQCYYPSLGANHHHGPSDTVHFMEPHHQVPAHHHRGFPFGLIMDSTPSYLSRRETVESMVNITGVRT